MRDFSLICKYSGFKNKDTPSQPRNLIVAMHIISKGSSSNLSLSLSLTRPSPQH